MWYGGETWAIKEDDTRRLQRTDLHLGLGNIRDISHSNRLS